MIGEFLLIVVGVLAALAVDTWRGELGDRERERQYLERLVADLDRTERELTGRASFYEGQLVYGLRALDVLQGRSEVPRDTISFIADVFRPTRSTEPRISRATYDDLISTGNLDLLRDAAVRDGIMTYYEAVERALFPVDYSLDRTSYRAAVRSLIPPELQFELQECDAEPSTCTPVESVSLSAVTQALRTEPNLGRSLTLLLQSSGIRTFDTALRRTGELRNAIQWYLDSG